MAVAAVSGVLPEAASAEAAVDRTVEPVAVGVDASVWGRWCRVRTIVSVSELEQSVG